MNEFLLDVQTFGLRVALSGTCVCVLVLLAARALRRWSDPLRHGLLFSGIIGLLAIPILVGIGQSVPTESAPVQEEVVRFPAEMLPNLLDAPAEELVVPAEPSLNVGGLVGIGLLLVWLLGTTLALARLAWALRLQRRAIVGGPWRADFMTDDFKAQLAKKLGLRTFPEVRLSPAAPMPLVMGIWCPVIVLPEQAPASWGAPQWEAVLLHEGAHIARRDHWAVLAQRLAVALYWWCPPVFLLSRRLNDLRENICDDYALQGPCDHFRYAELLIESAERMLSLKAIPVPLALLDSARGGLEARVKRLLEKERRPMTKLTLSGKLFAGSFLAAACLLTMAATAFSGGQAPAQKKVQIKIIVDGKEFDIDDIKLGERLEAAKKASAGKKTPQAIEVPLQIAFADLILTPSGGLVGVGKPDPRIEELVKQAEAIKPGSGADIRKALQGTPKAAGFTWRAQLEPGKPGAKPTPPVPPVPPVPPTPAQAGKKIIIIIEDGKVRQLAEHELKMLAEPGVRFHIDLDMKKKKDTGAKAPDQAIGQLILELQKANIKPGTPPPPAQAGPDMEALRRQLERLSADLQELRRHLDAKKK